jgi:hypothetical protein
LLIFDKGFFKLFLVDVSGDEDAGLIQDQDRDRRDHLARDLGRRHDRGHDQDDDDGDAAVFAEEGRRDQAQLRQ